MSKLQRIRILVLLTMTMLTANAQAGLRPASRELTPGVDGKRIALILTAGNYAHTPKLAGPAEDAKIISAALQSVNFDVTLLIDFTQSEFITSFRSFLEKLEASRPALVVVWYSGHGLSVGGRNYLIPVDAKLESARSLDFEAVALDFISRKLSDANENGLNLLLLDTDQDNPLARDSSRSSPPGAPPDYSTLKHLAGDNLVIVFSTSPGGVGMDSLPNGKGSPFANAFARALERPGLDWIEMFRTIQFEVLGKTEGRQKPTMIGVPPRFYLQPAKAALVSTRALSDEKLKKLGRVYVRQEGQEVAVYDGSYALLIGVSDYDDPKSWPKLPGVLRDLDAVEAALTEHHGFEVTKVTDPSDLEMEKAIKDFIRVHGAKENARLLIYYSGHGYSTDAGKFKIGWLVPRNAPHPLGAPEAFRVTALRVCPQFS